MIQNPRLELCVQKSIMNFHLAYYSVFLSRGVIFAESAIILIMYTSL